jgi:cation transport ATPase
MKKIYKLENLECASCAAKMEDGIRSLPGVETVSVNFLTGKLTIVTDHEATPSLNQIQTIVRTIEPDCEVIG